MGGKGEGWCFFGEDFTGTGTVTGKVRQNAGRTEAAVFFSCFWGIF